MYLYRIKKLFFLGGSKRLHCNTKSLTLNQLPDHFSSPSTAGKRADFQLFLQNLPAGSEQLVLQLFAASCGTWRRKWDFNYDAIRTGILQLTWLARSWGTAAPKRALKWHHAQCKRSTISVFSNDSSKRRIIAQWSFILWSCFSKSSTISFKTALIDDYTFTQYRWLLEKLKSLYNWVSKCVPYNKHTEQRIEGNSNKDKRNAEREGKVCQLVLSLPSSSRESTTHL